MEDIHFVSTFEVVKRPIIIQHNSLVSLSVPEHQILMWVNKNKQPHNYKTTRDLESGKGMFSLVWSETTPPFLFTTKSNTQAVFGKCRNFENNHKISSQETGPASPMPLMEAYPMESSIRKASIARVGKLNGLGPKFRAKPLASTLDDKRNKISGEKSTHGRVPAQSRSWILFVNKEFWPWPCLWKTVRAFSFPFSSYAAGFYWCSLRSSCKAPGVW